MAVQVPFIVFAVMILMVAIVDAFRKSAQRYLSVGDVRTIQSVFGRAFNAFDYDCTVRHDCLGCNFHQ